MDIFEKVKKLNLPRGKYVVIAGGALEAYGIRKSGDVDICVTSDVYRELKSKGWKEVVKHNGMLGLSSDIYEVITEIDCGDYKRTIEELLESAKIINGVTFVDLSEVIDFKKALGRKKDFKDLKLIDEYLINSHEQ